jgi:hypothetical protein
MLAKMAENPYQPPENELSTAANYAAKMPGSRPLLPLWRRVISVSLITLGGLMSLGLLASPVEMCAWLYEPVSLGEPGVLLPAVHLAEGLLGVAMIWGGFRLRRIPLIDKSLEPSQQLSSEELIGRAPQLVRGSVESEPRSERCQEPIQEHANH